MIEPKPTYTDDMGVNCPACGIGITTANAGGYRTYCEACVDKVTALIQAQAAIVAMLKECRLSSVKICVEDEYNRYYKTAYGGGGGAMYRFESLAELYAQKRPLPSYRQAALLEDEG